MQIADYIDADLLDKFEFHNYNHAIGIKKTCVSDWKEGYIDEHASGNI